LSYSTVRRIAGGTVSRTKGTPVGILRQLPQIPVFGLGQPQRARQRVDRRSRRADGSSLLEADVPVDADAGELGHLLPPQAGRAPPPPHRQANRLRHQLLPPRPQEVAEFTLPRIRA
jgi:hypothetical protein